MDNFRKIAIEYAKKRGHNSVRLAGQKDNYVYFRTFNKENLGHKLGLPHIIKINSKAEIIKVENTSEIMWAMSEEIKELQKI
ncbi:MAG: hypothetical protein IKT96_05715 [Paludibacteraceae bacterium]|nr:hypothetical protein [Paludibacteraceae bacterium]